MNACILPHSHQEAQSLSRLKLLWRKEGPSPDALAVGCHFVSSRASFRTIVTRSEQRNLFLRPPPRRILLSSPSPSREPTTFTSRNYFSIFHHTFHKYTSPTTDISLLFNLYFHFQIMITIKKSKAFNNSNVVIKLRRCIEGEWKTINCYVQ